MDDCIDTSRRRMLLAGGSACCAALAPQFSRAQAWPAHPVKAVQGYAPGGNADTIARLLGGEMAKDLGQPILVEAQAGAGGTLAAAAVARAKPDGYTLLLATGGHAVAGALYNSLPYDTVDSFHMVSTITFFPFVVVVAEGSPYRSLRDLLQAARTSERSIAYGTAGVGTTHHLAIELLAKMAKAKLLHVPYRGDAASVTALLSGDVPFIIAPPTAVIGHVQSGKMRAIAATGPQRWPGLPDVLTVAEQGVDGYDVRSWAGWMLPAGSPGEAVDRLHGATVKALEIPAVRERLQKMGGEARGSTPQEMRAMVAAEVAKWKQVVADAGIQKN